MLEKEKNQCREKLDIIVLFAISIRISNLKSILGKTRNERKR
jgi:hypothetical protein